ncbi:MAG: SH3 domain-containing protein [bacterium]
MPKIRGYGLLTKAIGFSLVGLLLFVTMPGPAMAAGTPTHWVTVDSLRLRDGPGTSHEVLTSLFQDQEVTVLGKQEGWANVQAGDWEGWVSAEYLRAKVRKAVDAEFLRLRAFPELNAEILTQVSYGSILSVLDEKDGWSRVLLHDQVGWMKSEYLTDPANIDPAGVPPIESTLIKFVTVDALNVRTGPGTDSDLLEILPGGTLVTVLEEKESWSRIELSGEEAWVYREYLSDTNADAVVAALGGEPQINQLPEDISTLLASSERLPSGSDKSSNSVVLKTAEKYLGVPYVWGGASPEEGFDCSGYVMYLFGELGVSLPHGAEAISQYGTPVEFPDLQPGDVIFFQNTYRYGVSHLGIWAGNNTFIHAPEPGADVSYEELTGFYLDHYWGARRILP